ncbi:hypothetical protein CEXT_460001 [Caerostris extrusa]|uniref:Uncharacterized protein n=1 Tax=Caerostris extrusa TaxID=172846 RepID=A0AAV4PBL2_CAEEX|nr:hypothetical protein CEXT_460001 [Caerostris extrusa]
MSFEWVLFEGSHCRFTLFRTFLGGGGEWVNTPSLLWCKDEFMRNKIGSLLVSHHNIIVDGFRTYEPHRYYPRSMEVYEHG